MKKIFIILLILSIVFAGIFVYQWREVKKEKNVLQEIVPKDTIKEKDKELEEIISKDILEQDKGKKEVIVELKIYRNEEFGFEFQHPESWKFEENSFYSPFSKFNLQGNSSAENYNPLRPAFLLNVVTSDFADRAVISRQNLGAIESSIVMGKIQGKKYEYIFKESPKISIDIPFEEYRMILGVSKNYEDIFNQIISSFKILE